MASQIIPSFHVIGISVRTTNENNQAAADIGVLWDRFMNEGIIEKIPNKIDHTVYSIYTDYERDNTRPYTAILGCKVGNLDNIPQGMVGTTLNEASYEQFIAKGSLMQGAVYNEWTKIWNSDLERTFTADFEVYDKRAENPEEAEVPIFIAVK